MLIEMAVQHLEQALQPGSSVTRYDRVWLIGGVEKSGNVLLGKIGFQGKADTVELWDDEELDFAPQTVPSGMAAPFAIDLETLQIVIQPRGRDMTLNGVVQALRAMLKGGRSDDWRIEAESRKTSLSAWLKSVDRVTRVKFSIRKPNPHWEGAQELEDIMESAEAEVAHAELSAQDGINVDSSFIQQTQHHIDRGYGNSKWFGYRSDTQEKTAFSSEVGEEEPMRRITDASGEVPPAVLKDVLEIGRAVEDNGKHEGSGGEE